MTKAELLDAVADKADATKADTEKVLDAFFDHVKAAMKKGEQVAWPGFGKFHTTNRAARTVANPQDRTKTVKVPATVAPKFTASSTLKSELNPKRKK
jgi:DNA-binding protein HU-beta